MASLDPVLLSLAGGLTLGVACAQLGGPISLNWGRRFGAIHERLRQLPRSAPAAPLRVLGGMLVAGVLAGGALAAYAAQPSAPAIAAPERLAAQAAGVIGSGDQLSLRIAAPGGERTLRIGDTYDEGWTLQALTPTKATLAKDGAIREVGLNPTGALASTAAAAAPTTVSLVGLPDAATIQHYVDAALAKDPQALDKAMAGVLTPEEGRRKLAYLGMAGEAFDRRPGDKAFNDQMSSAEVRALLGEAGYGDFSAMEKKKVDVAAAGRSATTAAAVADLAARPVTGATSFYAASGSDWVQTAAAQGADYRGAWTSGPVDAQGGRTFTLVAGTAEQYSAYVATRPAAPAPTAAPGLTWWPTGLITTSYGVPAVTAAGAQNAAALPAVVLAPVPSASPR